MVQNKIGLWLFLARDYYHLEIYVICLLIIDFFLIPIGVGGGDEIVIVGSILDDVVDLSSCPTMGPASSKPINL